MKKSKYETVVSLYEDTLKQITESETAWKDFLSSMATSYNYKLPLIHKVLLYAQKPDARAILPLERWNRDFGRFVAKGTKGIAFPSTNNTLKYYFDISDTVPTENSRDVPVWDMTYENIGIVEEYLKSNYIDNYDDIFVDIDNAVYTEVSNIMDGDFIKSLQKENSFFSSCNAETLEAHLKDLSVKSSSFLIMKRLNLNPDRYYCYKEDDFSSITFFDFNDKKVFNTVGHLINEPAIKILNDISLQLKLSRRYSNERQGQRTYLHSSRGLPVSGPDNNGGTNNGEIRKDEGEILRGGTTPRTSESANIGGAVGTLQSNSETGRGKNGSSYPTDERGRGSDGTAESRGYDGLGRNDEHNSLGSGGDSTQGDSIRLEAEKLPSVKEQVNIINEAEEEKASAFSFTQEIIDEVLTRGSGVEHGKFRIYEQFQKSLSSKENEKFLINEYGWGGAYPILSDVNIDEYHDGKGIHLSKGLEDNAPRITLKWKQVEKRISELIKLDRYLNPKEKENYPKWLEKNEVENNLTNNQPNDIKYEYKYDVGSVVYIGSSEYEITSISNDRVTLLDKQFPLLNKELSVSDFENKIEQSAINNHLKVSVLQAEEKDITGENKVQNDTKIVQDFSSTTDYEDAFFINRDNESVTWMYYNPDSNAGGQYVTNTISFYEIQQAAREYDSAEDFFDYLGSIANQELADVGTEWFEDAESQFLEQPDFTDCSKTTMQSLVTVVSEVSVYNRETEILYSILDRLNIDDISLSYDENGLVAKDDNNEWHGAEFYHFLVDETFVFENDGSVLGIRPELLDDFKVLSEHNDVEVKDYQKKAPEEKSRDNIRQALQHKKVIKLADPIYDKTHIDNARTRKNSNLYITFENNLYILRGDTSHNGVTTKNMHLSTFHNIDDTVKYLIENNIKAIDYSVESSISDSEKHLYRNIDINDAILMHEHNFSVYRMDNTEVVINDEFWENPANYYQCKIDDYQQDKMIDAISSNIEKINEKFSLIAQEVGQPYYLDLNDYAENYDWDFDDGKTVYQNTALLLISNEYEPLTDYLNTAIAELENDFEYKTQYNLAVNTLEELESYIDKYSGQNVVKIEDDSLVIEQNKEQNTVNPVTETEKTNFDLKSFEIEEVGKKARFIRNINAIKVLKECENENRLATPDEQQILAQYVGWGGIPEAFDQDNTSWSKEFEQLKNLLTPQEYSTARGSTLTAFYTPQTVISAVYKALDNIGFKGGNILEPSCGTGHFIGMLPDSMQDSKFYGVELDTVSAGIAKQLYQKSSISAQPFEETKLPDSFFDAVIGNVPFGDFGVADKRYDKNHFLIHDYFFAKSLDKLRPGGVIAFITSKGTMDKENSSVRKYIAQRADLLGAIRLPNNTFKGNAGTEVVSDIIFLQKRDRMIDIEPDWVQLSTDEKGIRMNSYFVEHPEMILGEAKIVSGRFRDEVTYIPFEDSNLESQLDIAISNIRGTFTEYEVDTEFEEDVTSIPADPDVRNYSYTIVDDVIYFRENSLMYPETVSKTADSRIRGLIGVRDSVRRLIDLQTNDYPDEEIKAEQQHLNSLYDEFTEKYGLINSRANNSAFSQDSSYSLLSSLEVIDDDGNFVRKADIFSKRTIKPHKAITSVDTSVEALTVSISEKAKIDIDYMVALTGKSEEEIFSDLQGVIYLNPHYQDDGYSDKYISADEYLSGNVRQKLNIARECLKDNPQYQINVMALEKVQPKDLSASEISVRLGSTWIPKDVIEDYIYETLETPYYRQFSIKVNFVEHTGEWNITNKSSDKGNVKAYKTYGTSRVNGYKLIEDTLNLRDIKVFDYKEDADGKRVAVLNQKETTLAQSKQELIKQNFVNWIWKDPSRRERLCKIYNERFNSIRPREYDGSHITFYGINPEITLRKHQVNAIARILYGGNTLLAHTVGAGKTFEMVAAAMESKRLGLCSKSMFVVPNHLTEQWASEFLQLYPAANILVATKKDFEKKNRRRFCSRISTGDYDAVIIGHSQFEKIPMSFERQKVIIEQQIDEITNGILELKSNNGERFSIKQLEKSRKSLQVKLQKLNDQSRKDDVVTFEELGVDRLFVDESHYYKNLYLYTKMRNVGGIAQTEAQKSQDLFMKCRYLDEITDSKGIVFATGTPISNSMVELYTIQRYLQYNTLVEHNLQHFDAWASTFGETVSAIELNPEGTGYRAKTRFAKFFNLPELMNMFKEVADIQTADMLKLPVPKANYHNVAVKPSEIQTEMVNQLSKRADKVRSKLVDSKTDNMLKITNDGRKLALDQRIINPDLPDFENSKVNACAENIFRIWKDGIEDKTTQLVFCDLSTPNKDGRFNVYDDIKNKLIDKGIPAEEIQFIHDAKTETQKQKLFGKVRNGDVRILFGSTAKMGAGTNVQDRIVASHDIDCPWRPSDLEQRLGRTVRQGNRNKEVDIYRYVTEQTFDAYLYQLVEGKQKFASQIMTSKLPVRIAEDIDETALSYAEIKMLATGNPDIKEKMDLDIQVQKLNLLKSDYLTQKFELEDKIIKYYPQEILAKESLIEGLKLDIQVAKENTSEKFAGMTLDGVFYEDKKEAGGKLLDVCKSKPKSQSVEIGEYRGFKMILSYDIWERTYSVNLKKNLSHYVELSSDVFGNIQRLDNAISNLDKKLDNAKSSLENVKLQLKNAKEEVNKPFEYEDELNTKTQRLNELNAKLNLDANRADEPSEEEVFFKEVSTEQDKDTLISNGYDNYVKNDRGYIFKVAKSDKDKVEQLLAVNSKKMCI